MSTGTQCVVVDPARVGGDAAPDTIPPRPLGWLAGTTVEHPFTPATWMPAAPLCQHCYGWCDDYRHGQARNG